MKRLAVTVLFSLVTVTALVAMNRPDHPDRTSQEHATTVSRSRS